MDTRGCHWSLLPFAYCRHSGLPSTVGKENPQESSHLRASPDLPLGFCHDGAKDPGLLSPQCAHTPCHIISLIVDVTFITQTSSSAFVGPTSSSMPPSALIGQNQHNTHVLKMLYHQLQKLPILLAKRNTVFILRRFPDVFSKAVLH